MAMNTDNIIRKIRLSGLDCYHVKDNESELFEFIKDNLLGLEAVRLDRYPDYIMYFKNGKIIFQHFLKNNILYINFELVWSILDKMLNIEDYDDTNNSIKSIIEQAYKIKFGTIIRFWHNTEELVEQYYKLIKEI